MGSNAIALCLSKSHALQIGKYSIIYTYLPENQSVQKTHAPELNEINNSLCQFAATTNSYTYVHTFTYGRKLQSFYCL